MYSKLLSSKYDALWGFPHGLDVKESACNVSDPGSIPESRRSPGEGNSYPLQYSCLENSLDRGAWWATVHGVTKNCDWATNTFTFLENLWSQKTFLAPPFITLWHSSFDFNDEWFWPHCILTKPFSCFVLSPCLSNCCSFHLALYLVLDQRVTLLFPSSYCQGYLAVLRLSGWPNSRMPLVSSG